jgi:hypothetical protein
MLGNKLIKAAAGNAAAEETDEHFQNTVLLLHGDGNQGATNFSNTGDPSYLAFKDNSSNNFPITVNGDAYGDNFGPYALEDGNWSNYFDGNGDHFAVIDNAAFAAGTGDFEISFWLNTSGPLSTFDDRIMRTAANNTAGSISILLDAGTNYVIVKIGASNVITGTVNVGDNEWHYVSVSRSGSSLKLFVDGVEDGSATDSTDLTTTALQIGQDSSLGANYDYLGYLSNFRFVVGSANRTSGYTVPTTPDTAIANTQILTCQSNRFVDNSSNGFAMTAEGNLAVKVFNPFGELPDGVNGSGFFDGTGDWVTAPNDAGYEFAGDFTIELWVYTTRSTNQEFGTGTSAAFMGGGNSGWHIQIFNSSNALTFTNQVSNSFPINSALESNAALIPLNAWNHIVVSRVGSTIRGFINGVQTSSTITSSSTISSNQYLSIGSGWGGNYPFQGHISNVKIVDGTGVTSVTVPTSPATEESGTTILTTQYAGTVRNVGFIDSGPHDFPITRVGNTTQGTFSPFSKPDGAWGVYLQALAGPDLSLYFANQTEFSFGTGDFSIELWVYLVPTGSDQVIIDFRPAAGNGAYPTIYLNNSATNIRYYANSADQITASSTFAYNQWNHIAVTRSGTSTKLFLNGVQEGSTYTDTTNYTVGTNRPATANGNAASAYMLGGRLSNLRIVKGEPVYTSNFTPSTSPLTLTSQGVTASNVSCLVAQSNRFVDNSLNNFSVGVVGTVKVTPFSPFPITTAYDPSVNGGGAYFDANNGYLTIPYSSTLEFGSADWTVEMWVYMDSTHWASSPAPIINYKSDTNSHYGASFGTNNPGYASLALSTNGSSWAVVSTSTDRMYGDAWNHIAFVRSGANIYIYTNGVRYTASTTYSGNVYIVPNVPVIIGRGGTGGSYQYQFKGSMSGLRVVKGTALYTDASFTPPTTPPTAVSGTNILCNYTNAGILDNTNSNILQTVGNAQVDTSVVKYGTGSMKFDGTGDVLVKPADPIYAFGTEDFTIEFWYWKSANGVNNYDTVFSTGTNGNAAGGFLIEISATRGIYIVWNNGSAAYNTTTSYINDSSWHHCAVVRSGSTLYLFIDGNSITLSPNNNISASIQCLGTVMIGSGAGPSATPSWYFNGYIDDLRITKGVARYTSAFTPPDKALPNIGV